MESTFDDRSEANTDQLDRSTRLLGFGPSHVSATVIDSDRLDRLLYL